MLPNELFNRGAVQLVVALILLIVFTIIYYRQKSNPSREMAAELFVFMVAVILIFGFGSAGTNNLKKNYEMKWLMRESGLPIFFMHGNQADVLDENGFHQLVDVSDVILRVDDNDPNIYKTKKFGTFSYVAPGTFPSLDPKKVEKVIFRPQKYLRMEKDGSIVIEE